MTIMKHITGFLSCYHYLNNNNINKHTEDYYLINIYDHSDSLLLKKFKTINTSKLAPLAYALRVKKRQYYRINRLEEREVLTVKKLHPHFLLYIYKFLIISRDRFELFDH